MRRIILGAVAAAMALGASAPASAQVSGYTVRIYFYDDAAHTNLVGYAKPVCTETFYGATLVWGYSTQYRDEQQGPYCENGEFQY
jgi:hypothetical protein